MHSTWIQVAVLLLSASLASALPSCEGDTASHCLADGADLSSKGIDTCLRNLGDAASADCKAYLAMIDACKAELDRGGVCAEAPANNEVAPCLIDRTPRDKLSAECAAALPAAVALEGLAKLWEDGKRELNKEDLEALSKTDLKSYTSWVNKRKKRARNVKGQQRDFAVKERKRESARKEMTMAAKKAAADVKANGGDKAAQRKAAGVAAEEAMSKQIKEDKTDTLREFTKADMKEIVNTAVAANYKSEL